MPNMYLVIARSAPSPAQRQSRSHTHNRVLPSLMLASADRRVMPCSPVLAPTAACFPRLCLHRPTTACCPRPCLRRPPRPCCPCSPRLCSCRNRLPSAERAPRAALARVLASTAAPRPNPCFPHAAVLASSVPSPPSPVPESAAFCRGRSGCLAGHLRAQLVSMERGSDDIIRRLS